MRGMLHSSKVLLNVSALGVHLSWLDVAFSTRQHYLSRRPKRPVPNGLNNNDSLYCQHETAARIRHRHPANQTFGRTDETGRGLAQGASVCVTLLQFEKRDPGVPPPVLRVPALEPNRPRPSPNKGQARNRREGKAAHARMRVAAPNARKTLHETKELCIQTQG
jgi:hypothetical protein